MRRLPPIKGYEVAMEALVQFEDDFVFSEDLSSADHQDQLISSIYSRLKVWLNDYYPELSSQFEGPHPVDRVLIRLISHHIESLSSAYQTECGSLDADSDTLRRLSGEYRDRIDAWIKVIGKLSPLRKDETQDRYLKKELDDFFLANKASLIDVYATQASLKHFVEFTKGSLFSAYVGSFLADVLAREYIVWMSELDPWEEDQSFPGITLREVDDAVLEVLNMGVMYVAECHLIRRGSEEIDDFGTPQWYAQHELTKVIAFLCDRSKRFDRGIRYANGILGDIKKSLSSSEAIALLSINSAANSFVNSAFFTFGNNSDHVHGFAEIISNLEEAISDKALLANVLQEALVDQSLSNTVSAFISKRKLIHRLLKAEGEKGHSLIRNGKNIQEIVNKFYKTFPDIATRRKALELLVDLYSPCQGLIEGRRHKRIVEIACSSLRKFSKTPVVSEEPLSPAIDLNWSRGQMDRI